MKKISKVFFIIITSLILIQVFRYYSDGSNIKKLKYFDFGNKMVELNDVFDDNSKKNIIYILPECESCLLTMDKFLNFYNKKDSQIIIIATGTENFNFKKFYEEQIKDKGIVFLIDRKNTFYLDFGLGLFEEFPTIIEYNIDSNQYKKIYIE
jgi:hypothetical protein